MLDELRKIGVFIKRDFMLMWSYKIAFSMMFFGMILNLFYLVVFGSMFQNTPPSLQPYGGDFIAFVLIGSIGWGFMWNIANSTSTALRQEMMFGTLESILLTPTSLITLIIGYSIFGLLFSLVSIILLLIIGIFVFNIVVFSTITVWTIVIFTLSAMMMTGLGMIFSALTIWQKDIGSMSAIVQNIAMFFCGVYFPVAVLPSFIQPVATYFPFYYAMEGLRLSLIPSVSLTNLLTYILTLVIWTFTIISIGIFVLHLGIKKAKRDGSLSFY